MLQKQNRLKSDAGFKGALAGKRLFATPFFAVFGLLKSADKNKSADLPTRFGLIVSKKLDKRATRRNRMKRLFREVIRTRLLKEYAAALKPYSAIVMIVRSGSVGAPYPQIEQALLGCFKAL